MREETPQSPNDCTEKDPSHEGNEREEVGCGEFHSNGKSVKSLNYSDANSKLATGFQPPCWSP